MRPNATMTMATPKPFTSKGALMAPAKNAARCVRQHFTNDGFWRKGHDLLVILCHL